jgi:hypothetical protein
MRLVKELWLCKELIHVILLPRPRLKMASVCALSHMRVTTVNRVSLDTKLLRVEQAIGKVTLFA